MHGTTGGLRTNATARLADLERRTPECQAWLRLLGQALRALDDPASGGRQQLAEPHPQSDGRLRSPAAPLFHERMLVVDARRLDRLMHDFVEAAGSPGGGAAGYAPSGDTAVQLVAAVLRHDRAAIDALAAPSGVDPAILETVAQLAAVTLLQPCVRGLSHQVPPSWSHGYCPFCGSWPLLAELRSLDRTRRLRCGRCGGDWRINVLRCAYCGEANHERLGRLVLDGRPETLTVETCFECLGYLKSVTTLQAIPPFELLLQDLETVELDLAALDRGFTRPAGDGFPLDLRVTVGSP